MAQCRRFAVLMSLLILTVGAPPVFAAPAQCRNVEQDGSSYTVCEADLRLHVVRLFWKNASGEPYRYLTALPRSLDDSAGQKLLFAINGGMFHPDSRPVGLYIENGRELARISTKAGPGNFHMRPNGIFLLAGETAGVLETRAYLKRRRSVDFATQSGPMLVIDGRLHPRFARSGGSQKARSGVGIRDDNTVVFALSDGPVTFEEFARLFRDRFKCPNALFLDGGSAPSLYAPDGRHGGNLLPLGPMIAVYGRSTDR